MFLTTDQCRALNYLVHELVANKIPFLFVNPLNVENNYLMQWTLSTNPLDAVASIVDDAIRLDSTVLIGCVSTATYNQGDSFFIGYLKKD